MNTTISILLLLLTQALTGQGITSGTVTDKDTGKPLVGVTILIEGENDGVISDIKGRYKVQNNGKTLRFSYIGYSDFVAESPEGTLHVTLSSTHLNVTYCPRIIVIDKRIKSAHNYTLLEKQELNLQNQSNIEPVLNTTPGLFMHSGALNTNRITIRGIGNRSPFSTNKIKAYLDDIPLTNGSGETTVEDIDLSFLRDIEVWKGPTSSKYGAGLGGMIALNTLNGQYLPSSLFAHYSVGSYGLHRNTINANLHNHKKRFGIHLNHHLTTSDGYRDNNRYHRHGGTLLANADFKEDKLQLLMSYTHLKAFIPSSLNEDDFLHNPTNAAPAWGAVQGFEDYHRLLAGVSYQQKIAEGLRLKYVLFLNHKNAYELRPFNILSENSWSYGARLLLSWNSQSSDKWLVNTGIELFRENYNWETFATNSEGHQLDPLSDNRETRFYNNLFAEAIYRFARKWKVNAGLNLNTTQYDLQDHFSPDTTNLSGDYSFDPILSPRLAVTFSPRYNNDYYLLASHGFSPPTLEETLTPQGQINPGIEPETAWNLELGTRSYFANERLRYEWSIYTMMVKNLLVARRIGPDQYMGINAGKTRHSGLELHLQYQLVRKESASLIVQTNYSYSDYSFVEFEDETADYSGNELTGTSPHQLSGLLFWQFKFLYGNLHYQFTDAQPLRDDNSAYSAAYSLLNAKAGTRFSVARRWEIDLYGGINNLFDTHHAAMHQINAASSGFSSPRYYYPGLPRHFYAGLQVNHRM